MTVSDKSKPAVIGAAVVLSDSTILNPPARSFHANSTGIVKVDFASGGTNISVAVNAGQPYPYSISRFYSTGTTATDLVALY